MYRIIIDGQYVPIPPEKITIKVDGDNKTMTLVNLGEINVIRKKKLTDIHLNCYYQISDIRLHIIHRDIWQQTVI